MCFKWLVLAYYTRVAADGGGGGEQGDLEKS